MANEICFLTACELSRWFRAGRRSPVGVRRAIPEHIVEINPQIRCLARGKLLAAGTSDEIRNRRPVTNAYPGAR